MTNGDLALILCATILAFPLVIFLAMIAWGFRALINVLHGDGPDLPGLDGRPGSPRSQDRAAGPSRPHTPPRRR